MPAPVALVTGAAGGVGRAAARRLAADGFRVALNDLADADGLAALAAEVGGVAAPADISDPDAVRGLIDRVTMAAGPVEVLVANAAFMSMGPFLGRDRAAWWRHLDVNLSGHFRLIQAVVPGMRALGRGRLVIIASGWGVIGQANATGYSASKAGLIALTKGLGRELAPQGILANAIAPGFIDTPQLEVDAADAGLSLDAMRERYAAEIPIGRLAGVEDIAAAIAFLAGPHSSAFVGQVLQPAGGVTRTRA
jgi:NAD(P)-dependent dehydrogenase (short-subunit alcohol dehydrogenase family)